MGESCLGVSINLGSPQLFRHILQFVVQYKFFDGQNPIITLWWKPTFRWINPLSIKPPPDDIFTFVHIEIAGSYECPSFRSYGKSQIFIHPCFNTHHSSLCKCPLIISGFIHRKRRKKSPSANLSNMRNQSTNKPPIWIDGLYYPWKWFGDDGDGFLDFHGFPTL